MKNLNTAILVLLILVLSFAVFSPCLKNSFVNWDDPEYVIENRVIQHASWGSVKQIFTSFFISNYQPVTILSYLAEYRVSKSNPFIYHFTNIALHLLNCLLVFWLILILSKKRSVSLLAALLFAVHPLHVESVAWVSERKDVLYAFFFLLAVICYLYYVNKASFKYYYFALFFFVLSLLSKAAAVTLPFILLLTDWLMQRRNAKGVLLDKIPFFFLSFIFGVLGIFAQYASGSVRNEPITDIFHKTAVASYAVIFYLGKILLPLRLSCVYPYPLEAKGELWFFIPIALLFIAVARSLKYTKKIVFGSAFFLITIIPVLQFVPLGMTVVADRYMYIPLLGMSYIVSEGFFWLYLKSAQRAPVLRYFLVIALAVIISSLSLLSWKRCQVWKDSASLWNDCLAKNPYVTAALNNRGIAFQEKGNLAQAIADFNKAIAIDPNNAGAYNNRGIAFQKEGDLRQAIADYSRAIALNSKHTDAYNNRGTAFQKEGDLRQAIADYSRAIAIEPNYAKAYYNRAVAFQEKEDFKQAINDFNKAITINPDYADAYNNLGIVFHEMGNPKQAIATFNKAIAIKPNNAEAYNNRGIAFQKEGDLAQAIADYTRAIALNPRHVRAYSNRGVAYQDEGDLEQAIVDYSKALEIDPHYALAYYNRALAYFKNKEFSKSSRDLQRANMLRYKGGSEFIDKLGREDYSVSGPK